MGDFKIKEIKNYMMTGISYLIPVCIIGGMFFAISIGFGGEYVQDQGIVVANQFLANLQTIGSSGLFIMIPVVGAYIAYAIAGKPALAPAFVLLLHGEYRSWGDGDKNRVSRGTASWPGNWYYGFISEKN